MNTPARPWRIALIVSLLLNAVLVAALATFYLRGPDEPPRPRGVSISGLLHPRAIVEAVGAEHRPQLEASWHPHREAMRARWHTLYQARVDVSDALRAQPFSRAALDAAFARLREAEGATAEVAQAAIGDFAETLDDTERARFADLLQPPEPRRGPRRGEDRDARGENAEREETGRQAPAE